MSNMPFTNIPPLQVSIVSVLSGDISIAFYCLSINFHTLYVLQSLETGKFYNELRLEGSYLCNNRILNQILPSKRPMGAQDTLIFYQESSLLVQGYIEDGKTIKCYMEMSTAAIRKS